MFCSDQGGIDQKGEGAKELCYFLKPNTVNKNTETQLGQLAT